jgi:hypothetical protein
MAESPEHKSEKLFETSFSWRTVTQDFSILEQTFINTLKLVTAQSAATKLSLHFFPNVPTVSLDSSTL